MTVSVTSLSILNIWKLTLDLFIGLHCVDLFLCWTLWFPFPTAPYNAEENILLFICFRTHLSVCLVSVSQVKLLCMHISDFDSVLLFVFLYPPSVNESCHFPTSSQSVSLSCASVWTEYFLSVLDFGVCLFLGGGLCQILVAVCGIYFPDQGLNSGSLHWEHEVLAIVPPGNFPQCSFHLYLYYFYKG